MSKGDKEYKKPLSTFNNYNNYNNTLYSVLL